METIRPKAGDVIAERYLVEDVLGEGGMGVVLRVRQGEDRYALKLVKPERASEQSTRRMLREARAVAGLEGPHLARVCDSGTLPGGEAYLLMDLVQGETLRRLLERRGRLDVEEACDVAVQIGIALAEAHLQGVIHRDLKPSNLMLEERDDGLWVTVLDFGIAKILSPLASGPDADSSATITHTGSAMGSPRYMSPEQLRDAKTVDARSDIWSLGVVLHEMVTGKPPFEADTHEALCLAIAMDPPAAPTGIDLDPAFDAVIQRCLDKDRLGRFLNLGELAEALAPFASARWAAQARQLQARFGAAVSDDTVEPLAADTGDAGRVTTLDASIASGAGDRGRRSWIWMGALAIAALALAASLYQPGDAIGDVHPARPDPGEPPPPATQVIVLPEEPPPATVASAAPSASAAVDGRASARATSPRAAPPPRLLPPPTHTTATPAPSERTDPLDDRR